MNIQIFGKSKCFDTKKAERYFKERGIRFQSINLSENGMRKGEFNRVKQAVGGLESMIDKDCKDKDLLALIQYIAAEDRDGKGLENQNDMGVSAGNGREYGKGSGQEKRRKQELRKLVRLQVSGLNHEYCIQADQTICQAVTGLDEYHKAVTVFIFVGTEGEINTRPIITHALEHGKQVAVPKCISKGVMEAYLIDSLEDLEDGSYGIQEPRNDAVRIQPEEIDLAVIPCCTCSQTGRRLGYGGGYYDRYLGRVAGVKAVICRDRIMRDDIPVEEHDQPADTVISEAGISRMTQPFAFVYCVINSCVLYSR